MWKPVAVGAALCVLAAVSGDVAMAQPRDGDEYCVVSDGSACALEDLTASTLDSSSLIYPGGNTRCAFDDFTNSSVDFSTNATYFFQVFPAPELAKKKLFLYFQGGGACIDDLTCDFALQCIVETFNPNAVPLSTGVLNRSDPQNMFNDWNIVHAPYCTGDLHVGNKTDVITESNLYSLLDKPECLGHNMTLHQVGYENTMAVLNWAYANFPEPEEIVIGGSSAGALGAQILSLLVANKWQIEEKNIRYGVLADSYVGVLPADYSAGELIQYYGTCDVDLDVSTAVETACDDGSLTVAELMSSMIEQIPTAEWLFIDSKADHTQRYFYALVDEGILGYPFNDLISGDVFFANMSTILDAYKAVSDKISTFFVEGEQHVFLTVADFYDNATSTTGAVLGDYINEWLVTNSSLDGGSSSTSGSVVAGGSGSSGSNAAPAVSASMLLQAALLVAAAVAAL